VPNYSIKPTSSTKATTSTIYSYSGVSPSPPPAGQTGKKGSGSTRPLRGDSQTKLLFTR
jgi:hypothetical protein